MDNIEEFNKFLKKYSTIPNSFIDDFFSFYKYDTDENDIIIDLNLVAKWLNMRKDNLKKTLIRSYIEDFDYKIIINKTNNIGRPVEDIFISTSCFKKMSMMSNTEKGKEVRSYYEKIESVLNKYKNHIIENLNKKIDILENNQKPKINTDNKRLIYVLRSQLEADDVFKLGKSKKFKERLTNINISQKDDMEIIFIYETDNIDQVESCVKSILKKKQYRKRKEIYQIDIDVLKEIIEGCDKLVEKSFKKKKQPKTKRSVDQKKNYYLFFDKQ